MNFWLLVRFELRAIFGDPTVKLTVVGATLLYLILYPSPYLAGVATEQPVVIIDHDQTTMSRQLIRHVDASSQTKVIAQKSSLLEAQRLITSGEARGILIIPVDFKKDLLLGRGSTLNYSGDGSYFMIYSAVMKSFMLSGMETSKHIQGIGMLANGSNHQGMELSLSPIKLNVVATYNPTLGYNPYLIPGLLLVILHQTMLIALGTVGAGQWQKRGYWTRVSPLQLVCARIFTFCSIYSLLTTLYVGWGFSYYGVTLLGNVMDIFLLMIPYLLSIAALGVAMSCFFDYKERPTQVFLLMGMPIIFTAGFVWPTMMIPDLIRNLSHLIPANHGIIAMLKINQMGADWTDVLDQWLELWGLFALFFAFAIYNISKRQRKIRLAHCNSSEASRKK